MRRKISLLLALCFMLVSLGACGQSAPTWQEQYDLGVRYLEEGNYEEAIIAFTAAIEIDSKNSNGYLKLAEAYVADNSIEQAVQTLYSGWQNCEDDAQTFLDLLREYGYFVNESGELVSLQAENDFAFSAYKEILDILYYGIETQWKEVDRESLSDKISYMWYFYPVESLSDAGYELLDLNGDGIYELITSVVSDDDWGSAGGMIYDLYTYNDGDIIHLASSGERDRYYLCENSIISNEGSSGASDSLMGGFYELLPDSTELRMIEMVRYYDVDTPDEPYYYSEKNVYDIQEMAHITAETAELILSKYTGTSLVLTTFARYTPNEARDIPVGSLYNAASELLPIEYLDMTMGELADLLGDDYRYGDGWFLGTAKPIYYEDQRVPLVFYFLDSDYSGIAHGDESIFIVECSPSEGVDIGDLAPGVPALADFIQLSELGFEGDFCDNFEEQMQLMGETGSYDLQYDGSTTISYYWFNNDDPYTAAAALVMISRH